MRTLTEESGWPRRRESTPRNSARRNGAVLGLSISFFALATLAIFQIEPTYRATALVTIDPAASPEAGAANASLPAASPTLVGRALRSPELARRVIASLHLDANPAFNADLRANPWTALFDLRRLLPEEWADLFLGPPPDDTTTALETGQIGSSTANAATPALIPEPLVRGFIDHVSATSASYAGTFGVSFDSHDPTLAAAVANAAADAYIVLRMESIDAAARRSGSAWTAAHLADLRAQMAASRAIADAWRKEHGIAADVDAVAAARDAATVEAKLADAHKAREAAEAKLQKLQADVSDGGVSGDLADAPSLRSLREQRAELERQRTELSARLGELHPTMQKLKDEIDQLGHKIAAETTRILAQARADAQAARATENALEARARAGRPAPAISRLAELERRAEADRAAYAEFLARSTEAPAVPAAPLTPDARVVLPAAAPTDPAFPRKGILLPTAAALSLAAAAMLVVTADAIQRRRRRHGRRSVIPRSRAFSNDEAE
jgi:polysaccharide biosynthesis transport protein